MAHNIASPDGNATNRSIDASPAGTAPKETAGKLAELAALEKKHPEFTAACSAPINLQQPCPLVVWPSFYNVIECEEHPNATAADVIANLRRFNDPATPPPVVAKRENGPYITLGPIRHLAPNETQKKQLKKQAQQLAQSASLMGTPPAAGTPLPAVVPGRETRNAADGAHAVILDFDLGDVDVMIDAPRVLARHGLFGVWWPSYSYGKGKKRGGRLFVLTDRPMTTDEVVLVGKVANLLLGGYVLPSTIRVIGLQGAPVRRSPDVKCLVGFSDGVLGLSVDGCLALAGELGLDEKHHTKPINSSSSSVDQEQELALAAASATMPAGMRERMAQRLSLNDNFIAGVVDREGVDLRSTVSECALMADAFARHGDGDPEPLWRHKQIAALFSTDPRGNAHLFSDGDERYTIAEADEKLAGIERQQEEQGFGWPSCAKFAMHRPDLCDSCRHRHEGKSPLNFATVATVAAAQTQGVEAIASKAADHTQGGLLCADQPGAAPMNTLPPVEPIPGGIYTEQAAVALFSRTWFYTSTGGRASYVRREANGALEHFRPQEFAEEVANVKIEVADKKGNKTLLPAGKWWREHIARITWTIVFDPYALAAIDGNLNGWAGFARAPRAGRSKMQRWLDHIRVYICGRDDEIFTFLIAWMAHRVQRPGTRPESIIVLRGETQGGGKDLIWKPLLDILGIHAMTVRTKQQIIGRFNAHLEVAVYIHCEETLWAGDRSANDILKGMITGATFLVERKFGAIRNALNRLGLSFSTNHDFEASTDARRLAFIDVGPVPLPPKEMAAHFKMIADDLDNGGTEEVLDYLRGVDISAIDFRNPPRTQALLEQQQRSASSVVQWLLACAQFEVIYGGKAEMMHGKLDADRQPLGAWYEAKFLSDCYLNYCDRMGVRQRENIRGGWGRFMNEHLQRNRSAGMTAYFIPLAPELLRTINKALNPRLHAGDEKPGTETETGPQAPNVVPFPGNPGPGLDGGPAGAPTTVAEAAVAAGAAMSPEMAAKLAVSLRTLRDEAKTPEDVEKADRALGALLHGQLKRDPS